MVINHDKLFTGAVHGGNFWEAEREALAVALAEGEGGRGHHALGFQEKEGCMEHPCLKSNHTQLWEKLWVL